MHNQNRTLFAQASVLLAAMAMTFLPLWWILQGTAQHTGDTWMYPLDDSFIHMELAANLAKHGTWGINADTFSSASSSILYTLLLAICFKLLGVHAGIPLIVNIIAAIALLVTLQRLLAKQGFSSLQQFFVTTCAIVFTPLPMMVLSGMEHTLQCLLVLWFINAFVRYWLLDLDTQKAKKWLPLHLAMAAMLVVAIRYEGMFLIAAAAILLLLQGRFFSTVQLILTAFLPVIVFGIYALGKGSYFLPNSVLIKGETLPRGLAGLVHFVSVVLVEKLTLAKNITQLATQRLLLLLPLLLLGWVLHKKFKTVGAGFLLLTLFTTLMHLAFAATGWFYRYEAYLMLSATVGVAILWKEEHHTVNAWPRRWPGMLAYAVLLVLVLMLSLPFVLRSAAAYSKAKQACINIYEQQYQMGRFLSTYYPNDAFAANDIGAVAFATNGKVLDLWGLGNIDVARARKEGRWNAPFLDSIVRAQNVRLAVVYDHWFDAALFKGWTKKAEWTISNNVICGGDTVSFYAVDATVADKLLNDLKSFAPKLPKDVVIRYY